MAADRAAAIAAAEAALTDAELDELARRLCVVLRGAWLNRQRVEAAQTTSDRAARPTTAATRSPRTEKEEQDGAHHTDRPR